MMDGVVAAQPRHQLSSAESTPEPPAGGEQKQSSLRHDEVFFS